MSVQMKKKIRLGGKLLFGALFIFLMLFNIQIATSDGQGDIDLFGVEISVGTESVYATQTVRQKQCRLYSVPPQQFVCPVAIYANCICETIIVIP